MMKRQRFGIMNVEQFKHPRDCDARIAVLNQLIKSHKTNAKDGIGTFKEELVSVKRRRRELRAAMQLGFPFKEISANAPPALCTHDSKINTGRGDGAARRHGRRREP